MAGELEDAELAALLATGCSTTSPSWASSSRPTNATSSSSASRPSYNSRSTATRRWPGAPSGRASRVGSTRPSSWPATRCVSRRGAGAPDAQTHFTAQLVAIRREQGRLDELLPEIERLAGGDAHSAVWRSLVPLAYLDAGDRTRARQAFRDAVDSATKTCARTMLWLTATGSLCEAAAELGDVDVARASLRGTRAVRRPAGPMELHRKRRFRATSSRTRRRGHRPDGGSARALRGGIGPPYRDWSPGAARAHALRLRRVPPTHAAPGAHRLLLQAAAAARSLGMTGIAARAARHA